MALSISLAMKDSLAPAKMTMPSLPPRKSIFLSPAVGPTRYDSHRPPRSLWFQTVKKHWYALGGCRALNARVGETNYGSTATDRSGQRRHVPRERRQCR